jgi:hypothetical protein
MYRRRGISIQEDASLGLAKIDEKLNRINMV